MFALYIEDEVQFDLTNVNIIRGNAQILILTREKKKKTKKSRFQKHVRKLNKMKMFGFHNMKPLLAPLN